MNNPYLAIDQQIIGDIYTSTLLKDNITTLCDEFGSRFGGTEGEAKAAEFLAQTLRDYGLTNVQKTPFTYTGWRRGTVKLEITHPIQKEIPCITLPHSPPANIEATLVDMGDGAPEQFDLRAKEIKDSIVMTTSVIQPAGVDRWLHRNEKHGRAILAGAKAFIFVNHYPAYGVVTGGIGEDGYASHIPGVGLSYEDGMFLQRLVARHGEVTLKLTSSDEVAEMTSWNITGDIAGTEEADEIVMLGCHYDGHDISQGAQDPASGLVAVLESARVLAKYLPNPRCTIRFAFWGVEEIGLLGSTLYVQQNEAVMEKLRFYFNLDSAGAIDVKGIELNQWPELTPLFEQWRAQMAAEFGIRQSIFAHSDHFPFLKAGVVTGAVGNFAKVRTGRGYGHTAYDTLDKIDTRSLREAAALGAQIGLRLASIDDWPVARRGPEAVAQALDTPQNRAEEALFAQLRAFYHEQNRA